MNILDIRIILYEIGQRLLKAGNSPDDIRTFLQDEAERVAQEIEDQMAFENE